MSRNWGALFAQVTKTATNRTVAGTLQPLLLVSWETIVAHGSLIGDSCKRQVNGIGGLCVLFSSRSIDASLEKAVLRLIPVARSINVL